MRFKLVRERTHVSGTLSRFANSLESITSTWFICDFRMTNTALHRVSCDEPAGSTERSHAAKPDSRYYIYSTMESVFLKDAAGIARTGCPSFIG